MITQTIHQLNQPQLDNLIDVVDGLFDFPSLAPVDNDLLNKLVGIICARMLSRLESSQRSDVPVTLFQLFDVITKKESVLSLMNHPLIYMYTKSVILIAFYLWRDYETHRHKPCG